MALWSVPADFSDFWGGLSTFGALVPGLSGINSHLLTRQVPCSQGKMQGIRRIQPLFTKISLEMPANPVASRQIPCADQQGTILRTQGIISSFGPEQGTRRKTDPLARTLPIAKKIICISVSIIGEARGGSIGRQAGGRQGAVKQIEASVPSRRLVHGIYGIVAQAPQRVDPDITPIAGLSPPTVILLWTALKTHHSDCCVEFRTFLGFILEGFDPIGKQ